jgi:predicted ATPase/class 3 adenylate cyclase
VAELPHGTVTTLFTDIAGSTLLLRALGTEAYRVQLEVHRTLLRAAFGRHGGQEVEMQGDSFHFAFARASDAVRAAAEAQLALEEAAWPRGEPIAVRIGIHTGEPAAVDDLYIGLDIHRAARIMAAAHGGQVLVSESTATLVREELPAGLMLRDLGEHRLKDLAEPQRLYQLGAVEFPPLRTLKRTNLPRPASSFVGRKKEVEEVVSLLREGARLLTLTGAGGTGKTRLCLQAATEVADSLPDGVWWLGLASLRDPALVLAKVASTVGITEEPGRELAETLSTVLSGKRMLLVLDNAEHLLPDAAESVARLRDVEGPAIVVTSRERLQLAGERVYQVPPLAEEEGVELFAARARAVGSDFETTAAVEELCARLDNLPLAIELAAARTTVLSPQQILERLSRRSDVLKAGRDADPRQQTLRATIEWSYDLLDAEERELFARLAVFTGGSTLEAVEEICEGELDALASLVDKSLVRHRGERFWMLETIREYAAERLDESVGADDLRRRHGEFYERFAGEADQGMLRASVLSWFARVEEELPNLRSALARSLDCGDTAAALRTAAALVRYWEARGGATEGRTWLDRALATGAGPAGDRAKGSYVAARLAFHQGDLKRSGALFGDAVELARLAGDDATLALALGWSGWVHAEQGERETALALMRQCRELATGLGDAQARAEALLYVAIVLALTDDLQGADALYQQVLAVKREYGEDRGVVEILSNQGYSALLRGRYDDARPLLEDALGIARRLADTARIAAVLGNLGLVAVLEGRYSEAIELLDEDLRLCIAGGDRRGGLEAILGLAAAHAALGNSELAVRLDAIHQGLLEATGYVYPPGLGELLERPIRRAREQLDPASAQALARETGEPTLEAALAELTHES